MDVKMEQIRKSALIALRSSNKGDVHRFLSWRLTSRFSGGALTFVLWHFIPPVRSKPDVMRRHTAGASCNFLSGFAIAHETLPTNRFCLKTLAKTGNQMPASRNGLLH
jgi:hypothetical protein